MSRNLCKLEAGYVRVANSWLSAMVVVFIAYSAAVLLLDDYPIYVDGLFSLATAGYADAYPDLALVLERMMVKSQQHVPGYFLLLFVWGNLLDWTPLAMRLLTLFFGIISLALMYRLGRSLVSKEAGLLALVMLAGLAFYNIWLLPIRMYTLFVAAELLLLWMYFRAIRKQSAGAAQLIPVFLACVAFLYTHIFSLAALLGIGLYHLLFVPKNRSWLAIAGAFLLAGAVFLPWMDILIQGADFATDRAAEAITTLSAGTTAAEFALPGRQRQRRLSHAVHSGSVHGLERRSSRHRPLDDHADGAGLLRRRQCRYRCHRLAALALRRDPLPVNDSADG